LGRIGRGNGRYLKIVYLTRIVDAAKRLTLKSPSILDEKILLPIPMEA